MRYPLMRSSLLGLLLLLSNSAIAQNGNANGASKSAPARTAPAVKATTGSTPDAAPAAGKNAASTDGKNATGSDGKNATANEAKNAAPTAAVQFSDYLSKTPFGSDSYGEAIDLYTMQNAHGMVAKIMTFGATLTQLLVPDTSGKPVDVVLGFEAEKPYEDYEAYVGCIVGRVAGRIADASFSLNGKHYPLKPNSGPNTLHGGVRGFDKRLWKAQPILDAKNPGVKFTYLDTNDRQGFPGNLNVSVTYTLTDDCALKIDYVATTDKPTPVNISSHSYFNLAGAGNGHILNEQLQINADSYLPTDPLQLPTGTIAPVAGTPFDFSQPKAMGKDLGQVIGGYNHFYIIRPSKNIPALAATITEPVSGRVMDMYTTEPGIQFSTGNQLGSSPKAGIGGSYVKYSGFLLYDEAYPDALHHSNFPSIILNPGQTYKKTTIYRFSQGAPVPQTQPPIQPPQ
jgi:aldose 1-epimerase